MPSRIEEEAVVGSREPSKTKALEVRVVFEPSRIAPLCVAQAYEQVVPIVHRGIAAGRRDGRRVARNETEHHPPPPGVAR
jgi:hypothetical protein